MFFINVIPIGLVAQLVEQRTEDPCVVGSNPTRAILSLFLNAKSHIGFFYGTQNRSG